MSRAQKTSATAAPFWTLSPEQHLAQLGSSAAGLAATEAAQRLQQQGPNSLSSKSSRAAWRLLLAQFTSSISVLLLVATGISFYLNDRLDACIILSIVLVSGLLSFWQEKGASQALQRLLAMVQIQVTVLRDGERVSVPAEALVLGDVVVLTAGDIVPADCVLLQAENLYVDEAALTGESYPAEKSPGTVAADTPLSQRSNALWMGSHVQSGSARAVVVANAPVSAFGQLSARIKQQSPETEFERGVRRFGYLLMEVTLVLVVIIFAVNVYLHKPVMDSFLFALALAVGLTPQLLPAIISVNLSHGARRMAQQKVIVKQLASIENLGSMNVLCSDKTGTLTEGTVLMQGGFDVAGQVCERVNRLAYLNAVYESGLNNPMDQAIRSFKAFDVSQSASLHQLPYDFYRKRASRLLRDQAQTLLITKGAVSNVLAVCSSVEQPDGTLLPMAVAEAALLQRYQTFSAQGLRTLAVAYKPLHSTQTTLALSNESELRFLGFLTFFDPPKADCVTTINQLRDLGVTLKIITGDNRLVAATVSQSLGLDGSQILTGPEIAQLSGRALMQRVAAVNLFAEVEPNQKERIIMALKKAGFVVGYMGDGINDVSALHAADVAISVDSAADVAKDTAQIVLLEKNLQVLVAGVKEGRITFANTLKYVFMATSANFGNMFSMAGCSLFLPFLPLLPKQILLTNLLTDFPEMTIASDAVDAEMVAQPRRWDIGFISKFMLTFGVVSSVFDYLTFGLLLWLEVPMEQFRTGWFLESVISAALIVVVVRSRKPFFRSRPSRYLLLATASVIALTVGLPYWPWASLLGLTPLPLPLLGLLLAIVCLYIASAEVAKRVFYRWVSS